MTVSILIHRPVSVHLGRREVHGPEAAFFLETDHVLRADRVRSPQLFLEVFAVPSAELSRAVVNEVERPDGVEQI
jgi:hypothetical protein